MRTMPLMLRSAMLHDEVKLLIEKTVRSIRRAYTTQGLMFLRCTCCGCYFVSSTQHAFCFPCREKMDREP